MTWMDAVVPVAVEFMALEIDAGEVGRIRIGVDLGTRPVLVAVAAISWTMT